MRLALAWGCTVREARARCDAEEFALWQAFYRIDPWGEQRADLRNAINTAWVAAGKARRTPTVDQLMLYRIEPKPRDTKEFMARLRKALTTAAAINNGKR